MIKLLKTILPHGILRRLYLQNTAAMSIADPYGYGHLCHLLEYASVPKQHRSLFNVESIPRIMIDGGANVGKISDIALFCGMKVYAYEPNKSSIQLLEKKYKNIDNITIIPCALSTSEGVTTFFYGENNFDVGATIVETQSTAIQHKNSVEIKTLRLVDEIHSIVQTEGQNIYLLKLDIEGAEFDILDDIIETGIYTNIEHIVVETHERFFGKEGKAMMKKLHHTIQTHKINNIYLDWI